MRAFLPTFRAACRRARDTEWPDICGDSGQALLNRARTFLAAAETAALAHRRSAPVGTARYDSWNVLGSEIDWAYQRSGAALRVCHGPGESPWTHPSSTAKYAFLRACSAMAGVASVWPKDFREIVREGEATTAQRHVP